MRCGRISVTSDAGRVGADGSRRLGSRGGPLEPGSAVKPGEGDTRDERAGAGVTVVEAAHHWRSPGNGYVRGALGMEFEPADDGQYRRHDVIEVDSGHHGAIPAGMLQAEFSAKDIEMVRSRCFESTAREARSPRWGARLYPDAASSRAHRDPDDRSQERLIETYARRRAINHFPALPAPASSGPTLQACERSAFAR